jgi:hypothetical protein
LSVKTTNPLFYSYFFLPWPESGNAVLCTTLLEYALKTRFARWYIFLPKIPMWVYFGRQGMEKVGVFYGNLVYFIAFGKFYSLWYIS